MLKGFSAPPALAVEEDTKSPATGWHNLSLLEIRVRTSGQTTVYFLGGAITRNLGHGSGTDCVTLSVQRDPSIHAKGLSSQDHLDTPQRHTSTASLRSAEMAASFLYGQLFVRLPYPSGSRSGQTVVVTGSNVGLGKEAARHFVRLGASRVIIAVRSMEKGLSAKQDIELTTKCGNSVVEVWELDMASYASVQAFAARIETDLDRLDTFIANAGIAPAKYAVLEDNEASITVNVVSTLLLSGLVLPKMKATATKFGTRPTLTITSSGVHGHTTVPQKSAPSGGLLRAFNDKQMAEKYWADQYPISKLLEVLAVRAIAEKHSGPTFPVTINAVDPGLCHSELGRDFPTIAFWLIKAVLARSTEAGSRTLVHAASSGIESHGQYLSNCETTPPASFVTSADGKKVQERVWEELLQKLEALKPGVTSNFL